MAVDVEELILQPFRELVEKSKEAADNAVVAEEKDADLSKRMAKAARAVAKEGERALKKLQPLWDSQVEKYGDSFKKSMSQNGDLEGIRKKLDDLLYDFEDYTDMDGFDEGRFTEIQSTAKSFALNVIDLIKRLKIDGLPITPPPRLTPFPPLPPLPPLSSLGAMQPGSPPLTRTAINQPHPHRRSSKGRSPQVTSATPAQAQTTSKETSSGRTKPRGTPRLVSNDSKTWRTSSAITVDQLPPYSRQQQPPDSHEDEHNDILTEHGTIQAAIPPIDILGELRRCSSPDILGEDRNHVRPLKSPTGTRNSQSSAIDMITSFPLPLTTTRVSNQHQPLAPIRHYPQPLHEPMYHDMLAQIETVTHDRMNPDSPLNPAVSKFSQPLMKRERARGLLPMHLKDSNRTLQTKASVNTRISTQSNDKSNMSPVEEKLEGSFLLPPAKEELLLPQASVADFDDGLMLAETASTSINSKADCSIGSNSSLSLMKGFCDGAQAFRKGSHWHGVKKMSGYVAGVTTTVGRCVTCGYAHQYDELRMDVDREAAANFTKLGIRFRIRFLYKSHLHTTKMTEAYYGCLFCAHTKSVVREGDATVFASSDQLFRHLSRHPQPLPEVPGLTVLYGAIPVTDPDHVTPAATPTSTRRPRPPSSHDDNAGRPDSIADHLNDFDLHFLAPPQTASDALLALEPKIHLLPTATAVKDHVQRYGEKKLPRPDGDGTAVDLLQFFVGSHIIGVEFPARWASKWATGWHDGVWGVFPAKSASVDRPKYGEAPPLEQIGIGDLNSIGKAKTVISVHTRWKWAPDDAAEKGWLTFGKGETITNVTWLEKEHWCWSGTNGKGKSGVFPRSHVNVATVREEAVALPRPGSRKASSTNRPMKLFGRARRVSTSAASSISGGSEVVEIIPR